MSSLRALLAFAGAALVAVPAGAEDGYDGNARKPVHDGSGTFTAYGSESLAPGALQLGVSVDHARNPVVLQSEGDFIVPVVEAATTTELGVFYGLPFRVEAGVAIPFSQRSVPNPYGVDGEGGIPSSGLGDLRAEAKWEALPARGVLPGIAVAGGVSVPTGDGRGWLGAGVVQPSVLLIAEERLGPVRLLGNIGYRLRPGGGESDYGFEMGNALIYNAGVAWDTGLGGVTVIADMAGVRNLAGGPAPFEAGVGLRRPLVAGLTASAGMDLGLNDSIGSPAWRAFGGLSWSPAGRRTSPGSAPVSTVPAKAAKSPEKNPEKAPGKAAEAKPGSEAVKVSPGDTRVARSVAAPPPLPENGTPEALARARIAARAGLDAYRRGDYKAALANLRRAERSESWLHVAERVLLQKYIGFTEVAFDRRGEAKAAFKRALLHKPGFTLDPSKTSPKIYEVFLEAGRELKSEQAPLAIPDQPE